MDKEPIKNIKKILVGVDDSEDAQLAFRSPNDQQIWFNFRNDTLDDRFTSIALSNYDFDPLDPSLKSDLAVIFNVLFHKKGSAPEELECDCIPAEFHRSGCQQCK